MSFKYYELKIEFQGSKYLGWQIQKDFNPTVQGTLNSCLEKIFKSKNIQTVGSGRTDTRVHSLGHIIKLKAPFQIENLALKKGLNSLLPIDIRVLSVSDCLEDFRPTNDALKKEYIYLFTNNDTTSAFQNNFIVNNRFELDSKKMEDACKLFIGEHDFSNFYCFGSPVNSLKRTIFECDIEFFDMKFHGILPSHYRFRIVGNGFLKQMVRLIVGTIWEVGRGRVTLFELESELKNPGLKKLGTTAPPDGLYKSRVWYD